MDKKILSQMAHEACFKAAANHARRSGVPIPLSMDLNALRDRNRRLFAQEGLTLMPGSKVMNVASGHDEAKRKLAQVEHQRRAEALDRADRIGREQLHDDCHRSAKTSGYQSRGMSRSEASYQLVKRTI